MLSNHLVSPLLTMNIEKENFVDSEENSTGKTISRREFLRKVALFTSAAALGGTLEYFTREKTPNTLSIGTEAPSKEPIILENNIEPEEINGIDVYYMTQMRQVSKLYRNLDEKFAKEHSLSKIPKRSERRAQLRKEVLNPKERYVEFVIRASAFNTFQRRREETGVDFVEYAKMLIDSKNLCFENAKPSCELKNVLRRILIIEDEALEEIWNKETEEAAKKGNAYLLDVYFRETFRKSCPLDTDTSWAISDDYRVNTLENENNYKGGCFWSSSDIGKRISFGNPPGAKVKTREYNYEKDPKYKSLHNKQMIWLDFGVSHELIHYADNLPDEYMYDLHLDSKRTLITATGSFHEPWVSPFLSILAADHIKRNLRDIHLEGPGVGYDMFTDLPDSILLHTNKDSKLKTVKVVRFNEERTPYFPEEADFSSNITGVVSLDKETLTQNYAHIIELEIEEGDKNTKLYLPYAPFFLSKLKGFTTNVGYKIEVISKNINESEQLLQIVDETDINSEYEKFEKHLFKPIAKMKIEGTNAWCIWFQRPTKVIG